MCGKMGGWVWKAKTQEREGRGEGQRCQGFRRHKTQQVKSGLGADACTHVIIDSTLKQQHTWTSCVLTSPSTPITKSETDAHVLRTHTRTHTHLGGVDNHKDLLNGGGRSSLYQVLLYRPGDG